MLYHQFGIIKSLPKTEETHSSNEEAEQSVHSDTTDRQTKGRKKL